MTLKKSGWLILFLLVIANQQLTSQSCNVEGGIISTGGQTVICSGDGNSNVLSINLTNNSGTFSTWLLTDDNQEIISTSNNSSFDFEGFDQGVVLIYHASHDGTPEFQIGTNTSDLTGCYDLSNPISIVINKVNGGVIFDDLNKTVRTVCVGDGIDNNITLTLQDNIGTTSSWVITDENGVILDLPVSPPFNFEDAEPGTCFIYNVSYLDIAGLEIGNTIDILTGCFDLSNAYRVDRSSGEVKGGRIDTNDPVNYCSGDGNPDLLNITLSNNVGDNSAYIVADFFNNILAIQSTTEFNFEGFSEPDIQVYHLAYQNGLRNLSVGRNFSDLQGCYNFSNSILISLEVVDGGNLSNTIGSTNVVFCTDDGNADMVGLTVNNTTGSMQIYVLTTLEGVITDITSNNAIDFEGEPIGTCMIYSISYNSVPQGLEIGLNMKDISGCYAVSNPIRITKIAGSVNSVQISTEDATTICTGDGIPDLIDVTMTGAPLSIGAWLITDEDSTILDIPAEPPFDFSNAPSGLCRIFFIDYINAEQGIAVGNKLNEIKGCFELSNGISIERIGVQGGSLTLANGDTTVYICAGNSGTNIFSFSLTGASGKNSKWIVTENSDSIVFINDNNNIDFNDFQEGTCQLWHLSYEDGIIGLTVADSLSNLEGCFDLSNPIEINKQEGTTLPSVIFTNDNTTVCIGEGQGDNIIFDEIPGVGSSSRWIVTDNGGKIIRIQLTRSIFMDDLPGGLCLVRNIKYEDGIIGLEEGNNISDLQGCLSLSNAIQINKTEVSGGNLTINPDNTTQTIICKSDENIDPLRLNIENKIGDEFRYVTTNGSGMILALSVTPTFDLSDITSGFFTYWHIGYISGLEGLVVGGNINQLNGCYSFSNPVSVEIISVNGGEIQTVDGSVNVEICTGEGINNLIEVMLFNEIGNRRTWIITNNIGEILDLPNGPVFNFEEAPTGVCFIYNLSYVNTLNNLEIGNSLRDLEGCYDLSNGIRVSRNAVAGGTLSIEGDGDFLALCAGDNRSDTVRFDLVDQSGPATQLVIMDNEDNILEILNLDSSKDFNDDDGGICYIRAVSFFNVSGLTVGNNLSELTGCFAISNEVRIRKDRPEGGVLTNDLNETRMEICVGEGVNDFINVRLSNVTGPESRWFITDEVGTILENNRVPPFNLENAPTGTCRIYHVSYKDQLSGTAKGLNLSDLEGCYNISNALTVVRKKVEVGQIADQEGDIEKTICIDDDFVFDFDLVVEGNIGEKEIWVITDTLDTILQFQAEATFGFDDAGEGSCLVYHLSYNGELLNLAQGNPLDSLEGCYLISNSYRVNRVTGESCTTSTVEIDGISYTVDVYPNPVTDQLIIHSDIPISQIRNVLISSMDGKIIQRISPALLHIPVDVTHLPSGMNLLSFSLNKSVITVRFIKR